MLSRNVIQSREMEGHFTVNVDASLSRYKGLGVNKVFARVILRVVAFTLFSIESLG